MMEPHKLRPLGVKALGRALDLYAAVLNDQAVNSLAAVATTLELPVSTAYRIVAQFEQRGLLVRVARGRYGRPASPVDRHVILAAASRLPLRRLADRIGRTVHLGVFNNGMVTYVVKETFGDPAEKAFVFTREGMQLEAYCTGIGQVLLANLDDVEREAYLAEGPFIRLTPHTIIDPDGLRAALATVRAQGYAVDGAQMSESLFCVAVPVRHPGGQVIAAISASAGPTTGVGGILAALPDLRACADQLGAALTGS